MIRLIMFLAGFTILQIFLSKSKNKWLGLMLPIINVILSLLATLGRAFFQKSLNAEIIMQIGMVFLMWNIPTVIFIAIYLACREKFKKKKEINKMNIQDLQ